MYYDKKYSLMRCHTYKRELFMEFWNDDEQDCFSITQSLSTHRIHNFKYFNYKINKYLMFNDKKTPNEWFDFINEHLEHNNFYNLHQKK